MKKSYRTPLEGLTSSELILGVIVRNPCPPKFREDDVYERLRLLQSEYPTLQRLFPRDDPQWMYSFFTSFSTTLFEIDMANLGTLRLTNFGREYIQDEIFVDFSPRVSEALDDLAKKVWYGVAQNRRAS